MGLCASSDPNAVKAEDLVGLKRKEKLHLVFKHLDANGNGVLTLDEMLTTATTPDTKGSVFNEMSKLVGTFGTIVAQSYALGCKATEKISGYQEEFWLAKTLDYP